MNEYVCFTLTIFTSLVILTNGYPLKKPRISLSPSTWDAELFQRLETISLRKNSRPKPLVYSKSEGVVSGTTSVLAVHAGTQALRNGGNAMDACLTTAMAEVSLTAGSKLSFAGVTNILYYHHRTKRTHNLDAGWKIPKHKNMEERPNMETLGDSVLVPGFIAGMHEAAEFAEFPLSSLLEPALYFAEKGFRIPHELSRMIHRYYEGTLLRTEEGKSIFTNPDTKSPYKPGELFHQPQLAQFIKSLQKHGKNYMYRGTWARQFIDTINKYGGKMRSRDLSRYELQWHEPASTTYSGYHVTTTGSKWGGVELMEMLQLLKEAGVSSANDSYLTNSTTLHALMSISQYSQFISDYLNSKRGGVGTIREFFQVDASPKGRQSNKSADMIWAHLCNSEGVEMIKQSFSELVSELPNFDQHRELKRGSSGIVAIDNKGNICALSHSANSNPWGTGLFVEGIALPHSGAVFQDFFGILRPGSHIPSGLQPVIIFRDELNNKKKIVTVKEHEKKPVRVTEKPTHPSTERDLGPIGPRGVWDTTEKMPHITKQSHTHPTPVGNIIATATNKPKFTIGPLIGPRGIWGYADGQLRVPKQPRPTVASTAMQKTADLIQRLTPPTPTSIPGTADVPKKGQKSIKFRQESLNWNEIGEEKVDEPEEENKINSVEESFESIEEEHERQEEKEDGFDEKEKEYDVEEEDDEMEEEEEQEEEHNEPLSIGGLYTENDLDTILPRPFTPRGHYRILNQSRENWFRNFVREILQRQQKRHKLRRNKKIYQKKKPRKRWSKPFAALSVIGQSAPEAILQYIHNLIDNHMDAKQASDTPMFFSSTPGSRRQTIRLERFIFSNDVINEVRSRGMGVNEVRNKEGRVIGGEGAVISVTDRQGRYGCSHPDSEGYAESQ